MNIRSRYNQIYYSPSDMSGGGAGAGAGAPGAGGAQQMTTGVQKQPGEEEPKTPEEIMSAWNELWNAPEVKKPADGTQQQQVQQTTQGQPSDRLQTFLKEQKYFEGIDQAKMGEAMRSGDPAQITPIMNQMMTNMHTIMLANMDKFGEHYYKKAVADSTSSIGSSLNYEKMYDKVFAANPALQMPAIAPMMKATIKQMIAKGADSDKAVKDTIEFFKVMGNTVNKAPPNVGGRPGSYSPSIGQGSDGKKADYDALWDDKAINF